MAHIGDRLRSLIVLLSRGWVKGWGDWGGGRVVSRIAADPPVCLYVLCVCVYVYMCFYA